MSVDKNTTYNYCWDMKRTIVWDFQWVWTNTCGYKIQTYSSQSNAKWMNTNVLLLFYGSTAINLNLVKDNEVTHDETA